MILSPKLNQNNCCQNDGLDLKINCLKSRHLKNSRSYGYKG